MSLKGAEIKKIENESGKNKRKIRGTELAKLNLIVKTKSHKEQRQDEFKSEKNIEKEKKGFN